MSKTYILYPAGKKIYGKASLTASPWDSDAVDVTEIGSEGLYEVDTDQPYLYLGEASSAASTDESIGTVGDIYYGTVNEGDVFMLQRLHAWDWNQASTFEKVRSLYHATTLIDKFRFHSSKADDDQNLEFPRGDDTSVPKAIREAAYLIADALLSGRDPEEDFEALLTKVETFGPVRTEFATDKGPPEHLSNLIPSPGAWARIKPFLRISSGFDVNMA